MAKSSMPIVALTRLIERFRGSVNNYKTCSTTAATAAKTVAFTGFVLAVGASVKVKFTYVNTAAAPTLNVNGTGAKTMQYNGVNITSSTPYLQANGVYEFVYDGTYYQLVSDGSKEGLIREAAEKKTLADADTIPLSDSEASNATKKITWANIKEILETYFDNLYSTGNTASGMLLIGNGGTGASTREEAFNNISHMSDGLANALDLNKLTQPGFYAAGSGSTNLPAGEVYGNLLVVPYRLTGNIYPAQLLIGHGPGSANLKTTLYYRGYSTASGKWEPWKTLGGSANYSTAEQDTGLTWIDGKTIYQKTINFGALGNTTAKNAAHGISSLYKVIAIEITAYNPSATTTYFVPHVHSAVDDGIGAVVDKTNITIRTNQSRSAISDCYVTLKYLKS